MSEPELKPVSRWEILGAWLHLWTPRRGAEIPPIPWRKVGLGALGVLVVLGAAVAFFGPRIADSKSRDADAAAEKDAIRVARETARLTADQRLHTGAGRRPPGRLSEAGERAARKGLLLEVEAAILADAQGRVRAGSIDHAVKRVACDPYPRSIKQRGPEETLATTNGRYSCLAVTGDIRFTGRNRGKLGYPFWTKVDFATFRYGWCKINPKPGELTGGRSVIVPLAAGCDLNPDNG